MPKGDRVTIKHRQNSDRITVINLVVNRVVNKSDTAFLRKFVKYKFVNCQVKKYSIAPDLNYNGYYTFHEYIFHFSASGAQTL